MPIVAMTGAGGAGRSAAAEALELLGFERVSFGNRLRHMIAMSAGLPETVMVDKADEPFDRPFTFQAFHIDGMCRIASAWTVVPDEAPKRLREKAARRQLHSPREVMDFVRHDLFEACVTPEFWVELFKGHYRPDRDSNLVVDDLVSMPERVYVRSMGGLVVGIDQPEGEALEDCDLVVANDGTVAQLQDKVVSAVFGQLRGVPMQAGVVLAGGSGNGDVAELQQQIVELNARLEKDAEKHEAALHELQAEREALKVAVRDKDQELAEQRANSGRAAKAAKKEATAAAAATAAERTRETDAAALAARLALALGLEAGLGKDPEGHALICIDLPAGRVSWPVDDGLYPLLPRYDKAPSQLAPADHRAALLDPQVKMAVSTEQALAREGSDLAPLAGVLTDLVLLAEGCKVHRAYRAKQAPKGECPTCWSMWEATERLRSMGAIYGAVKSPEPTP